jgi:ABC-2 type transport system permease protein
MIIIAMIPTWIVAGVMLKIPLLYFLPGVVLSIPGLRGILAAGLLVDLLRPYLTWDNPTKAVKQNLNVVFAMFVAFWVIGIGAFLAVKMITAGLALWQVYLGVIVYLLLLMVGLEMILRKTAAQRYAAIEV